MPDRALPPPPPEAFVTGAPPPPPEPTTPEKGPDIVGRAKEFLTKEPAAGAKSMFGETEMPGRVVRAAGEMLLPGSVPGLASLGAMAIPGEGALLGLARALTAGGATYGAERMMGREATGPAAESTAEAVVGGALGGAGRAGARVVTAALDKTARRLAEAVATAVPEFSGATAEETLGKVFSGEGMRALGKRYGTVLGALFKKYGDPDIIVPSLSRVKGDIKGGMGSASELMTEINSMQRNLQTMAGDVSRRQDALQRLESLDAAEQELEGELKKVWPKKAQAVLDDLRRQYRKGKELMKLFSGGQGRMTGAAVKKGVEPEGRLNIPDLQSTFLARRGALKDALGEDFSLLDAALRRGETNPLARDIPGRGVHMGGHVTPYGGAIYPRGLPRAPRLVGKAATPEQVAAALRLLGARETGAALEGQ